MQACPVYVTTIDEIIKLQCYVTLIRPGVCIKNWKIKNSWYVLVYVWNRTVTYVYNQSQLCWKETISLIEKFRRKKLFIVLQLISTLYLGKTMKKSLLDFRESWQEISLCFCQRPLKYHYLLSSYLFCSP